MGLATISRRPADVFQGLKQDDFSLSLIYCLDEDDEWTDQDCWIKANPSLGTSISMAT